MNKSFAWRGAALLSVALLCSCAGHRMAGSMKVTVANPVMLRVESYDPANVQLQVWNRGPDDVRFEQVAPGTSEPAKGVLKAEGREFQWQATVKHLELVLTVDRGEATIGYVVRSDRGVSMTMGAR